MNIYYNLVFPSKDESPIRVVVTHHGKVYRKSVGINTKTKTWNGKKTGIASKDNALRLIRIGLESVLDEFSSDKAISEALNRIKDGKWSDTPVVAYRAKNRPSFTAYFKEWASKENPAQRQRMNTYNLITMLMGEKTDWDGIDSAWYCDLMEKMNARKYSKNYQGSVIAKIKTVMGEGLKKKYHTNIEYKEFKKPENQTDSVSITRAELDKIWDLELKDPMEQRVRDLFIIGCYTGARFEDFSKFGKENIVDGKFRYIQRKTGERVVLPLSPRLKAALKRNGWKSPDVGQMVFNREVKVVCMKAGITDLIEIRESKGEGYEHKTVPKYKLVSSHTCRRTLCTLLDQEGVPMRQIMVVSGHKTLSSLQKYLRKSDRDTEEIFGRVKFFK